MQGKDVNPNLSITGSRDPITESLKSFNNSRESIIPAIFRGKDIFIKRKSQKVTFECYPGY
jgi:hypothetical protein